MGSRKSHQRRPSNPHHRPLKSNTKFKKACKGRRLPNDKSSNSDQIVLNESLVEEIIHDEFLSTTKDSASPSRSFFLSEFQSANSVCLSSLELESIKETSFVDIPVDFSKLGRSKCVTLLGDFVKGFFGSRWKEELCEGELLEGEVEKGSPSVIMLSTSATRTIELLRGVRAMTNQCHGAKLFSKHVKVEEQISLLKKRVNFASGTPSRLKKLVDVEAVNLSRLKLLVIDIDEDVKGYSLLTLPQVKKEFWELYVTHFHQLLMEGIISICLFGSVPKGDVKRGKRKAR